MVEKDEETRCPYPSLDLSYDLVKGIPYQQRKLAENYSAKLITLFSVATGVLGIGVPFGANILEDAVKPWSNSYIAIFVAMAIYIVIAFITIVGFWLRNYYVTDDPVIIREDFWELTPWKFKKKILEEVEKAYKSNEHTLKWKTVPIRFILVLLSAETVSLVLAFLLGTGGW